MHMGIVGNMWGGVYRARWRGMVGTGLVLAVNVFCSSWHHFIVRFRGFSLYNLLLSPRLSFVFSSPWHLVRPMREERRREI